MQDETIIYCRVEGGSWTLVGTRGALGGWRFRAIGDEGTFLDFMNEDFEPLHRSDWVEGWEAALALFDEHPWPVFQPLQIHPDFAGRIWAAVEERLRDRSLFYPEWSMGEASALLHRDDWFRLCHGGGRASAYSEFE